ncbi:MAG: CotH kinase family protein [Bacteroidales bacterium]|nr:CotH kinase family protein [Bacteroidales bacterium]
MDKLSANAIVLIACLVFAPNRTTAQTTLYDLGAIQKIEVYFSQPNWDYQLDTAKHGADGYIIADWVKINGTHFNTVGVKYKGSSSYDSTYRKNPLHIELDNVIAQSYQGIKDIKLSNCYADPSMIREVLSYYVLGHYMIGPRANFAQVYINNNYIGLYSNTESIGKSFCSQNFNVSDKTFIKCNPIVLPSPVTKSNLRFIPGADSTAYFNLYEIKSDFGWNELVGLCDVVTNTPSEILNVMNMDRVLWMLAFNSVLVNLDSYTGVFAQNYYIYKDATNRFNPIVWDLNMSFGGFPFVGSSNTSMGSLTIANMQQLTPTIHATDQYWPLIKTVMGNQLFRKQYFAHLRTITNEMFTNSAYLPVAQQLQQLIDTAVQSDMNKFYSYVQFQNGLTNDYSVLNYQVPGISNLMSARVSYLQSHTEFSATPPTIVTVQPTNNQPQFNEMITIRAEVLNATEVLLGYRMSSTDNFNFLTMYDDGNHNDLVANDQIYACSLPMSSVKLQFYVSAVNNNAAAFSPERAEFEFYSLQAMLTTPQQGDVVINEFVAKNNTGFLSEYGERADWIELYNNTSQSFSMFGLFLSDNAGNPTKWAFPENTLIQPQGYLMIIADERPSTDLYLHCNFKLSADGEIIILCKGATNILDQYSFGVQTADVSMGRCPNGTGSFVFLNTPSFGQANCPVGVEEMALDSKPFAVYPNPVSDHFSIAVEHLNDLTQISIINSCGVLLKSLKPEATISVSGIPPGLYVVVLHYKSGRTQYCKLAVVR